MKSSFIESEIADKSLWVSPQDLLDAPGMPSSIAGIHYRANMQGWIKRKKEGVRGGKAVEYDVMSFPQTERENVMMHLGLTTPDDKSVDNEINDDFVDSRPLNIKLASTLATLVTELEPDEVHKALKLLSKGGLSALMPLIFTEQHLYSLMGASQQSIQTLMAIESLPTETRKEILSRYGIAEQNSPVAPDTEPHKKAV